MWSSYWGVHILLAASSVQLHDDVHTLRPPDVSSRLLYRSLCVSPAPRWLSCSSENERASMSARWRERERETRTGPPRPWRSSSPESRIWWGRVWSGWSAPPPDTWTSRWSPSSSRRRRQVRAVHTFLKASAEEKFPWWMWRKWLIVFFSSVLLSDESR